MIRENQRLLNGLNVLTDGVILLLSLPAAFWLRFYVLPGGTISVPLEAYLLLALVLAATHLFSYAAFGMYHSNRKTRLVRKLTIIWLSGALNMAALLSFLFVQKSVNYSRWTLAVFFLLSCTVLSLKRIVLRVLLRFLRRKGYNLKHVLLVGADAMSRRYLQEIKKDSSLGYQVIGYVASRETSDLNIPYLGGFDHLEQLLEAHRPDEVISAMKEVGDSMPAALRETAQGGLAAAQSLKRGVQMKVGRVYDLQKLFHTIPLFIQKTLTLS